MLQNYELSNQVPVSKAKCFLFPKVELCRQDTDPYAYSARRWWDQQRRWDKNISAVKWWNQICPTIRWRVRAHPTVTFFGFWRLPLRNANGLLSAAYTTLTLSTHAPAQAARENDINHITRPAYIRLTRALEGGEYSALPTCFSRIT